MPRPPTPTCPTSNYDLTGSPQSKTNSYQCPECGVPVSKLESIQLPWYIGSKRNHILFTTLIPSSLLIAGLCMFGNDTNRFAIWYAALTLAVAAWVVLVPMLLAKLEANWPHGGDTRNVFTVFFDAFIYSAAITTLVVLACWLLFMMAAIGSRF